MLVCVYTSQGSWQKVCTPWRCLYALACCIKATWPFAHLSMDSWPAPIEHSAGYRLERDQGLHQKNETAEREEEMDAHIANMRAKCRMSLRLVDMALLASSRGDLGQEQRQLLHIFASALHELILALPGEDEVDEEEEEDGTDDAAKDERQVYVALPEKGRCVQRVKQVHRQVPRMPHNQCSENHRGSKGLALRIRSSSLPLLIETSSAYFLFDLFLWCF